jgi:hypothetical protein
MRAADFFFLVVSDSGANTERQDQQFPPPMRALIDFSGFTKFPAMSKSARVLRYLG